MVAIDLLVKTEEKLTISHHPWSCALRILLRSIGGRAMSGRVIIGGIGGSFAKLSIQWTNAFINDSWCLALFISGSKSLLEDLNRGHIAKVILKIGLVVE